MTDFFTCLRGKIPLTPFFPLMPAAMIDRQTAVFKATFQVGLWVLLVLTTWSRSYDF
jgi:hypothetical protein